MKERCSSENSENKRTSLVPSIRNKKGRKKSQNNQIEKIQSNTPEVINDKPTYNNSYSNINKDNNPNIEDLTNNNYIYNDNKIVEKITIKNTTTKSVETRTPDGYYTNATQSDESVKEYTKYENSNTIKNSFYDEVIDLYPSNNKESNVIFDTKPLLNQKSVDTFLLENPRNQTMDLCLEAVKENGLSLQFVDSKYRNKMIEIIAIKQNGLAIQFIDEYGQSESLCLEAVKQNGLALEYIVNQNEEICCRAIQQNSEAYKYVRIDNHRVKLKALKSDGLLLRYIDDQNDELCLSAVSQNGLALKYVKNQKTEICKEAIRQNWVAFHLVLEKNYEICMEAVKNNGLLLEYIKEQDEKLCLEAVNQNPHALQYVLRQNNDICRKALYKSGLCLQYVEDKTPQLCLLALEQNTQSMKYIPIKILQEGMDLKDYVFIYSKKHILINSIKEVRGLRQIHLPTDENGYLAINAICHSDYKTSFVLQLDEIYIDNNVINSLAENSHFIAIVND